ncbi:MAG: hypothetical protein ACI9EW_000429 [Cellvibrionaceae bacterium]|jgi:hypothetical protein
MTDRKENKIHFGLGLEFTDEVHSAADLETHIISKIEANAGTDVLLADIPHFLPAKAKTAFLSTPSTQTIGHYLAGAKRAMDAAETAPHLANSPALSTPILGKLWGRIRGQMHELVLFYVNRSGVTHSRVETQLIEAIDALTQIVDTQQAEIDRLKSQVAQQEKSQEDKR